MSGPRAGARVVVGMSGGVDSSLAAALLVEQGYDVTGVYMRNWSQDLPGHACPWAADLADAERVAVALGIDLQVWDYEERYKRDVVDYLVASYERGLTPNPDVMCNEKIKFGVFAQRAFELGADYIATGHYARVQHAPAPGTHAKLLRAADEHKDQTYFLWRVGGEVLQRVLFPIGGIPSKAQVRALAAERGLETAAKPDSDGICFIGPVGIRQFLLSQLQRKPGPIVEHETGAVLGTHEGAFLYTLGQRKGLDLGGGPARYVVRVDVEENVVYVSADRSCPALWTRCLQLDECRWVSGAAPRPGSYLVRTRHTRALQQAQVQPGAEDSAQVTFEQDVSAVAAGQAVSVYAGQECLGGGIVAAR